MALKNLSLRSRIFIAMILLVLLASVLIGAVTIHQYNEEAREYHADRLERKEAAIRRSIDLVIDETFFPVITEKLPVIFREEIFNIANIHGLQINLYDLDGQLLKSSKAALQNNKVDVCLDAEILNQLSNTAEHRYVFENKINGKVFQSSYSFITDKKFKNIAILNIPYLEDDDIFNRELNEFLLRLGYAYLVMILAAIVLAYFVSKYITQSLRSISDKLNEIRLEKRNKKIEIETSGAEIETLVKSYNSMIDELEESAVQLATSEREQAWREMAKQVAHEIKNPLTPMRLSVQSFQRRFNPADVDIHIKVSEFSNTLIQQIDTMSSIASAFSNFAKMPAQQNEQLNIVHVVKLALDIFNENYINFEPESDELIAKFDRTQLIRVVTNLVKNGIQAIQERETESPQINVRVFSIEDFINITVEDNGSGITEENKIKVFEPKFTTKTSGMGLGLAMVKNIVETYKGRITFTSEYGKGTIFTVAFPKQ